MVDGIKQMTMFGAAISRACQKAVRLSYNGTIIGRNNSCVIRESNDQSIADFYAGKSVFITGGTGFLGKVFIEKLLYSCKEIENVYILIRDKKGQSTQDRLRQMLNNPIFNRVKKSRPLSLKKLVPIVGDISLPDLGINPDDGKILAETVSVVFHSAATIRFFEPLQVAMNINYEGTRRVLDLSRRMKKLHNFVYISTAYSQTIYPELEEQVYPAPADVKDVYNFIEKYNFDVEKTNKFIGGRPNTYTFTKAMSENYAGTYTDIPVTIVRPSIVGATLNESCPGWIDHWYAMTGVAVDVARGLNHSCLGSKEYRCDLIPVDYVTSLSIVAGAKYKGGDKVPVYNSVSSGCNPIKWETIFNKFIDESKKYSLYVNNPSYRFYKTELMYDIATVLLQKCPAHVSDFLLRLKGEEPRYMNNLGRVLSTRHSMEFFVGHDWTFKADAARALFSSLSKADQEEFPCDPVNINWDSYLETYFNGVRTHLLPKQLEKEKAALITRRVNKPFTR